MKIPNLGKVFKETAAGWYHSGATHISAGLAYFAVFSIAPLLVIITFLVGLVHKGDTIEELRVQFKNFVNPEAADLIARIVVHASPSGGKGIGYTVMAFVAMVVGASAFTHQLQRAVDVMWGIESHRGNREAILHRLWTLAMGVSIGVLLLLSIVVNSETSAYRLTVNTIFPGFENLWHSVDIGISFLVIAFIHWLSYELLPTARVRLQDGIAGALIAAVFFSLGRWVVALYVFEGGLTSVYGAAGSLMILLVWLYYCSLVFLFGARFTRAWVENRHIIPSRIGAHPGPRKGLSPP
jgi:membrane protein